MSSSHQFCLKWNNFTPKVCESLHELWQHGEHIDVTLVTSRKKFSAHRLVLCACSRFFRAALQNIPVSQSAVLLLPNVISRDLEDLLQFIYTGEINIEEQRLKSLVNTANLLQIEGISTPNSQSESSQEDCSRPKVLKRKAVNEEPSSKKCNQTISGDESCSNRREIKNEVEDDSKLSSVKLEVADALKEDLCNSEAECSYDDSVPEAEILWSEAYTEQPDVYPQCSSGSVPPINSGYSADQYQQFPAALNKVTLTSGKTVYHCNGYRYFRHNLHARKKGGAYLRCTARIRDGDNMLNCRGRLFVDTNGMLELRVWHNHQPDWEKIQKDLLNMQSSTIDDSNSLSGPPSESVKSMSTGQV